jgi:hypothetical protein
VKRRYLQFRNQRQICDNATFFLRAHFLGFNRYLTFRSLIDFRHIDNFFLFENNQRNETLLWIAFWPIGRIPVFQHTNKQSILSIVLKSHYSNPFWQPNFGLLWFSSF